MTVQMNHPRLLLRFLYEGYLHSSSLSLTVSKPHEDREAGCEIMIKKK